MLPKNARLTTSEDFAKATKSGTRLTSENLVGYLYIAPASQPQVGGKCGLIINKSVGGSVTRHRIARQIRHSVAPMIVDLPSNSLLVIRVLKNAPTFTHEVSTLVNSLMSRSVKKAERS
ncbi:MAG: ribonuclease P protein component [Candidatus Planktophila sp.]